MIFVILSSDRCVTVSISLGQCTSLSSQWLVTMTAVLMSQLIIVCRVHTGRYMTDPLRHPAGTICLYEGDSGSQPIR